MLKHIFPAGLVLGLVLLTAPTALMADDATVPGRDGGYMVKQGDTLWDLSGEYLDAPANWPDLWKANPQVKDPDLIFPGEKITIPGSVPVTAGDAARPGGAPYKTMGAEPSSMGSSKEEPFVDMGRTILIEPKKAEGQVIIIDDGPKEPQPLASVSSILSAGFVAGNGIKTMAMAGSPQIDRHMFTLTEQVYVADDGSLKPGDKLMTFRPGAAVVDPGTDKRIGSIMVVSGLLDVKARKGKYAVAEVTSSFSDINITDKVVPYADPPLFFDPVPRNPKLRGKWGYIAALIDNRGMNAQESIAYINLGSDDGVRPGDSFEVRRSGGVSTSNDGYFDPRKYSLPDVKVGDAMVISVQPNTATVVLTSGSEPIKAGYRVYYER